MLIQFNCIEFNSRILDPFINTDRLVSYKAAGHRSRYFDILQLEHKAVTYCLRDEHLARPHKRKEIEGDCITPMPGLLTEK